MPDAATSNPEPLISSSADIRAEIDRLDSRLKLFRRLLKIAEKAETLMAESNGTGDHP